MAGSPLKKARRLAATVNPADPLDEAAPRPALACIPWNKVELTEGQRTLVASALADRRTRAEVAAAIGVSPATLRRLIREDQVLTEAADAAGEAELDEIRQLLLAHGRAGDTVALIFLGKAFHGLRDRDDARSVRVDAGKAGGVLLLPAAVPLDEWEAAAAAQQAQYRERPEVEASYDCRTVTPTAEGLTLQSVQPGDLPS